MDPLITPASLSLAALLAVIVLSLTSRINVGVLAMALAWLVATFAAGWKVDALMAAFPSSLFLTLLGVTLLFGAAERNHTLAALTERAVRACRGRTAALPWLFFVLAGIASSLGPGAIAATALIAPLAMATSATAGVSPLLMALMVANGANAGNLSPFSSVGLIVQAQMIKAGLPGHEGSVFFANFVAHTVAALIAWAIFGRRSRASAPAAAGSDHAAARAATQPPVAAQLPVAAVSALERRHWITIAVLIAWIAGVMWFRANPGLTALAAASVLLLLRTVDDKSALASVPWAVIVMVCGVSVLIAVLEKTGGMDLFTTMLSKITAPGAANGMMAFVTGLISTYSSTSGVVYPAFLPTVPGLVEKLGGGDPLQLALSINVGAALVDVSPLSTIGALCLAAAPAHTDTAVLFRRMLVWGFAMVLGGAVFCQFFVRWFAW